MKYGKRDENRKNVQNFSIINRFGHADNRKLTMKYRKNEKKMTVCGCFSVDLAHIIMYNEEMAS